MLRVAEQLHTDACTPLDLIDDKKLVGHLFKDRSAKCLIVIHLIGLHDLPKFQQNITQFLHDLIANGLIVKCVLSNFHSASHKVDGLHVFFAVQLEYFQADLIRADIDRTKCRNPHSSTSR